MTMVRGAFSHLLAPGFRKMVFESYQELPTEADKWINMQTASTAYIEDFNMAGFGTLVEKVEGGRITYQDPALGEKKRYVFRTFGLGFRITQEMLEDNLYGAVGNKLSRALGRAARHNFEVVAHSVLNNATDTDYVGFDGLPLLSTAHTLIRGGTAGNRPAVDADLGLLPYQAAIEHFHNLTDESGLRIAYTPWRLIHSVGNMWAAQELTANRVLPGGTNDELNLVSSDRTGITPWLGHYLTDTDAWFVLAKNHDLNYFDRRKPTFSNTDDFDTGDAKFKVTRRNGSGFGDWRGVYGSVGA